MFYDRSMDTRQIRLGPCEHILVITKELQEFSVVLLADFSAYHDGAEVERMKAVDVTKTVPLCADVGIFISRYPWWMTAANLLMV
jgi:hypothetical protein